MSEFREIEKQRTKLFVERMFEKYKKENIEKTNNLSEKNKEVFDSMTKKMIDLVAESLLEHADIEQQEKNYEKFKTLSFEKREILNFSQTVQGVWNKFLNEKKNNENYLTDIINCTLKLDFLICSGDGNSVGLDFSVFTLDEFLEKYGEINFVDYAIFLSQRLDISVYKDVLEQLIKVNMDKFRISRKEMYSHIMDSKINYDEIE